MNRLLRPFICLTVLVGFPADVYAQDIPEDPPQIEDGLEHSRRVVADRPTAYFLKRALHPFSWIDAGIRPLYRTSANLLRRKPAARSTTVRVGVNGAGSGSGFGPQITLFHDGLFGRNIEIEVPLLYTYARYEVYQLNLKIPLAEDGPLDSSSVYLTTGYRSRPSDKFFGIGNDSELDDQTRFRSVSREAAIGFSTELSDHLQSRIQVAYRSVGITRPHSDRSTQDFFQDRDIPGLLTGARLRSTSVSIDHNTKDRPHLPTEGGNEFFEVSLIEGIGKGDFSYWKYRLDLQRFFPLSRDHRKVLAIRAMAESNQEKGGSQVPFFDMPTLGDPSTLRGFQGYRFYDKSAMSLGLEYRYRIWQALDWGLFVDEGQVAPEVGDFGLNRLHTGYGARLIMMPKPTFPISVDVGRSNEQWRLYIGFNPNF